MPNFANVVVTEYEPKSRIHRMDLGPYKEFLATLQVNQVVSLPLEEGETARSIKRRLTVASKDVKMRIRYTSVADTPDGQVQFKVMPLEKRPMAKKGEKTKKEKQEPKLIV